MGDPDRERDGDIIGEVDLLRFFFLPDGDAPRCLFFFLRLFLLFFLPRPSLGLRLLLGDAAWRCFFFLSFLLFARNSGETDLGGAITGIRPWRPGGGGDGVRDMEGLRCRWTIGDRERLSNLIGRAPGSGVRDRRKYPGGVRLRARNLGDIERRLL